MQSLRYGRRSRSSTGTRAVAQLGSGLAIGAGIGVTTSFLQARLPMPWDALANSASPWLAGGFAAGALQYRRGTAVAAGLSACVLEVVSYYVTSMARGFTASHGYVVFWTVCALVGGPLFGLAGWGWRHETGRRAAISAAFLPGTFFAEAAGSYLLRLHYVPDAVLYLAIGAVLLVVVWPAGRLNLLAWTAAVTVIGLIAYGPLLAATMGITVGA